MRDLQQLSISQAVPATQALVQGAPPPPAPDKPVFMKLPMMPLIPSVIRMHGNVQVSMPLHLTSCSEETIFRLGSFLYITCEEDSCEKFMCAT